MNDFDRLSYKKPGISLSKEMPGINFLTCLQCCEVILERIGVHLQNLGAQERFVFLL